MTSLTRRRKIRQEATALLEACGVGGPAVPVDRVARELGATVRFSPLDDELSGLVYRQDGRAIIGINALHHPNRQRFTIAHEIGHLRLHLDRIVDEIHVDKGFAVLQRDPRSATGLDRMEIEANLFAAELLMPAAFLETTLKDREVDVDDDRAVAEIARQYKVSAAAMRFRLGTVFG